MIASRPAPRQSFVIYTVLLLCAVFAAHAEVRSPQPGEVFREFSIKMQGSDWRVTDPDATYVGTPGNSPTDFLPNPVLQMNLPGDVLTGAVRAEAVIDAWGGHVGTTGLQMRMNGNGWLDIPYPAVTTPPAEPPQVADECYMHQWNPVLDIPLDQLRGGTNTIQGNADRQTCFNFNWGQWGWYAITLRVYYNPDAVAHPSGAIMSPVTGGTIGENPTIQAVAASSRPLARIHFLAYYDGYDSDGDGDGTEYHHSYHITPDNPQPGIREHVGTATGDATSIVWNTGFVPDQAPGGIRLVARICDAAGFCTVSSETRDVTLARGGESVLLFQPSDIPERYWVRDGQPTKSSNVRIPADVNLGSATEAFLLARTWNGISGHAEPGEDHWRKINGHTLAPFGENHRYAYNRVPVPLNVLRNGDNTVTFHAETVHHGIEIQWPGPALLVRFSNGQPTCGDGSVGNGEQCDDAGDSPTCDADCTAAACGDGHWNSAAGEECDDGNTNDNDGCGNDCTLPAGPECGNGAVDPGEQCDTGGASATCDLDCTFPVCGDGFLNFAAGEQCDDGNTADGDFCDGDCRIPSGNSLPAYYGFEGSGAQVTDSSGNDNHGTLAGADRDEGGRFGNAVRFHGNGERVDLGFLDAGGTGLTVAAWFRADDFGTMDGRILSKTTSPDEQAHYLMLSTIASGVDMRLRFRLKTADGTTHTLIGTGATVRAGVWTHVAASYDGLTMRLYKDGGLIGSRSAGGAIAVNPTVPLTLGLNADGTRPFDGLIDEVRLEPRTLGPAEIADWMNTPIVVDPGGCTSDVQCDDGLFCNGRESCRAGDCLAGEPVVCVDPFGCTTDRCDETTDSCESSPDDDRCDDGLFCNGREQCHPTAGCVAGSPVSCGDQIFCTTDTCNEATDRCDHAPRHEDCNDGAFCNGEESCSLIAGCTATAPPCAGSECDEGADSCAECLTNGHCDDGEFCNGVETCSGGACTSGGDPCSRAGEVCDELLDRCDIVPLARLETVQQTVSGTPERVFLQNAYVRPVVVCTVEYGENVDPVVPRISQVYAMRFDVRLQNPGDGPVLPDVVHCLVGEEGVWDVGGLRFEARRFLSTRTDGPGSWLGHLRAYGQSYESPVVIGQVMTSRDDAWSVFWSRGEAATTPPSTSVLRVGKAVGQDPLADRNDETIGYFVFDAGRGTIGGVEYVAGVGSDTVVGFDDGDRVYQIVPALTPPAGAAPGVGQFAIAAVTGMDGNDGGWANVTRVTTEQLRLFVDEDQLGDGERAHTSEQVAYLVLGGPLVYPAEPECSLDAECDNGLFCDGAERCNDGFCASAGDPCGGLLCDETTDSCASCLDNADCDDGLHCNGAEVCDAGACASGTAPCGGDACDEQFDTCATECEGGLPYATTFDGPRQPEGWYDTAPGHAMTPADGFSRRWVTEQFAFGTASTESNIHSHLVTEASATWADYSFSGRLRSGGLRSGIGVTVLSDYPTSDRYYRLGRWENEPRLKLDAHGATLDCDAIDTGVDPEPNRWYRFEVRVDTSLVGTRVRARAWPEGTARPEWQQDCTASGPGQLTQGTVGVWATGPQLKYWDDLAVTCN